MDNYNSLLVGGKAGFSFISGIPILLLIVYAGTEYLRKGSVYNSTTYNRFMLALFAVVIINAYYYHGVVDYDEFMLVPYIITILIYLSIFYLFLTMVYQPPMPKLDIKF
jgi:hypothetical protein